MRVHDFMTLEQALAEVQDLSFKVQFVIECYNKIAPLEDGAFTFPDGDTWFTHEAYIAMSQGKYGDNA